MKNVWYLLFIAQLVFMKKIILIAFAACLCQTACAQRLGQKFDWLKLSYKKIPLRDNLPFYDTAVAYSPLVNNTTLKDRIMYYFESVIGSPNVDTLGLKYSGKGTFNIYTDSVKDEEHTFVVNYTMDVILEEGKYEINMRDFDIFYLTNKVEFPAKYKHASANDGKSNYFMALFNDQNHLEIKKLVKILTIGNVPDNATVGNQALPGRK